ncbi:metal-dependent hydrolase [Metabacillus idriensis]|uniref:metal-dependent hydrolase n=1 Tax=Metabacillus idriensis TaxID=324768 RepID=UPI001748313E|nr:metal-dependent hydrolase [Metabacillus idriensis]
MDTSTHITMGFGLAGLAFIDPAVAARPELASAVLIGTVLGSNAPDFDYGIRLFKGNGMYTEHHRGLSHSIPAWFMWTGLLTAIIYLFHFNFTALELIHLSGWIFLAVVLHVIFDIFNAYGTQAARPFTKKWLSLNFIPLFDPLIVFLHLLGFALWGLTGDPGLVFLIVYLMIGLYLLERFFSYRRVLAMVKMEVDGNDSVTIIPTIRWSVWNIVLETDSFFDVGELRNKELKWIHTFEKADQDAYVLDKAKKDENVGHFLKNSKHVHSVVLSIPSGYEIRFFDLRFRAKNHYPYMAVCQMTKNGLILSSCTGWFHQADQFKSKLISHENAGKNQLEA